MLFDVNHSNGIYSHLPMVTTSSRAELLRCSILESLKAKSPSSPLSTSGRPAVFAESRWSREVGRNTATLTQEQLEALSKERQELFNVHYRNLLFERSVDEIGFSSIRIDQEVVFEALLSSHHAVQKQHPFFALHFTIRRRIYRFCFPHESRKISLSPHFATMDTFSNEDLASPWDVLNPVFGGLQTFRKLRQELMTYFWTHYHFHVTLSQFTGPRLSPLTLVWLPRYLEIIQFLTVEADFTRFSFGAPSDVAVKIGFSTLSKGRAEYGQSSMNKTENLLVEIVKGLCKRRGKTTMAEFNLMCRRYVGARPLDDLEDAASDLKPIPYCSGDDTLYLCDAVCDLRGILHKSRVSGFTHKYTKMVIRTFFADGVNEPNSSLAKNAWPPVPIRTENPIGGKNQAILSLMNTAPFDPLPFAPISSFANGVENQKELLKKESSINSEKTNKEDTAVSKVSGTLKSKSTSMPANATQNCPRCIGSINGSNTSIHPDAATQSLDPASGKPANSPIAYQQATPKWHKSKQESYLRVSNDSQRHVLVATPNIGSRNPTPPSPNTMNQKNEQDPAFVRTIEALRSLGDDENLKSAKNTRLKSMIPSPIQDKENGEASGQYQTYQGVYSHTTESVRRYFGFVKRLKG